MSKIKLTKGELKRQRDSLKQFQRYLPTLQLKKQQLQMKILEVRKQLLDKESAFLDKEESVEQWVGLLADPDIDSATVSENPSEDSPGIDIEGWIIPQDVDIELVNVAGATIPFLKEITFREAEYDYYATPFWIDKGISELRALITLLIEVAIIKRQLSTLEHELRVTTQRVNLFEKIKIPECLDNIRIIRIYLGDQQANASSRGMFTDKSINSCSNRLPYFSSL